ncbi:hypothetical protein NM688_g5359 [Phlebia brevispora]|uniref:Uncharacterized protein n=1 Tax=Phlebia brevispora TaxID=194682 RepID=A0ACC1SWM6_9APHY|nr:hypothetical protein NM688_g5359 [Phlebia brevispora]
MLRGALGTFFGGSASHMIGLTTGARSLHILKSCVAMEVLLGILKTARQRPEVPPQTLNIASHTSYLKRHIFQTSEVFSLLPSVPNMESARPSTPSDGCLTPEEDILRNIEDLGTFKEEQPAPPP